MEDYSDIDRNLEAQYEDIVIDYDIDAIYNSIENIITVYKGELPGRPEFGSEVHNFLFDLNDEISYIGIEEAVISAIERWEPRVVVQNVVVDADPNLGIVSIKIVFILVENNEEYITEVGIEI